MIFVTGDTHGDYTRFKTDIFPEQKEMTKEDFVIICGDFGIWDTSNKSEYWMDWLENKPFTTLFVDGNHENYDILNSHPIKKWHGRNVHFIRPTVIHLMRGQLFEIAGKRVFTMGGASSHDISDGILEPNDHDFEEKKAMLDKQGKYMYRINHHSWWQEELPAEAEYAAARSTLQSCGWRVDYIFTHCAPSSVVEILSEGMFPPDALTDFHEEISQKCEFDYWFFGHYHENRRISRKYVLVYEQIIELPA